VSDRNASEVSSREIFRTGKERGAAAVSRPRVHAEWLLKGGQNDRNADVHRARRDR